MIAVYLSPDRTQILRAKFKKSKLTASAAAILPPYVEAVESCDVHQLSELFYEIKKKTAANEELYFVLPDHLFVRIDCFNYFTKDRLHEEIEKSIKMKLEDVYVSFPITVQTGTIHKKTACILEKNIIETLAHAAKEAGFSLASIEPASMAYLRGIGDWAKEKIVLFLYEKEANLLSYSPISGYYTYTLDEDISPEALQEDEETVNQLVREILIKTDDINQGTFGIANPDIIEIHLVTESAEQYASLQAISGRMKKFGGFSADTDLELHEQEEWAVPVGALFQCLDPIDSGIYDSAADFMHISSASVLPETFRKQSRFEQLKKAAKKYSRWAIVIGGLLLIAELGAILYYSSIEIPDSLQKEYTHAQKSLDSVKNELKIIEQYKKEEQHPLEALTKLIANKPKDLGFTSIQIGEKNTGNKNQKMPWVTFTVKTSDPVVLQTFTEKLSEEKLFEGVRINQISSDKNNVKSANISLKKGKVAQ